MRTFTRPGPVSPFVRLRYLAFINGFGVWCHPGDVFLVLIDMETGASTRFETVSDAIQWLDQRNDVAVEH